MNQRIVIKVGSHVLTETDSATGQRIIARDRMRALVNLISDLQKSGYEVLLVSSGAVAAGSTKLGLDKKVIANKQALAAIGQPLLLGMYQSKFNDYDMLCSQILLSADDFDSRKATAHAKAAIDKLLEHGVIPIINENDATAVEELVFGDNDRLSAHVAYYFDAQLLIILSDIRAYYDKDPNKHADAKPRKVVTAIEPEELEAAHSPNNEYATGGIVTKLQSADFLLQRNREMFLASGFDLSDVRSYLIDGVHQGGTLFRS